MGELDAYLNYVVAPGPLSVVDIGVMRGANYFSGGPVVIIRLDLGQYDEVFTNQIEHFHDRLRQWLPSLQEHHCSEGRLGGFFFRVETGTLLGHVTEHVALELQTLAGMDAGYGKTRSTSDPGVYNVVFRFLDEAAGVYAGKAAVNLVNALLQGREFDIPQVVDALVEIRELRLLGPSTQSVVDEAKKRAIPWIRLDAYNLVQLGTGRYRKWIRATLTSDTGLIAAETADDKHLTLRVLKDAGIPVPRTIRTEKLEEILAFHREVDGPIVVKPRRGHLGEGISLHLDSAGRIAEAFQHAAGVDPQVMAQPHQEGSSFRLLVIDYKTVAAVRNTPPAVTGDGERTIAQLVEELNRDPRRDVGDKGLLSRVELDEHSLRLLGQTGRGADSVPGAGENVVLKVSGNLRLGGSAEDCTDQVHPVNRFLAERACRALELNVAGVDVICPDISKSIFETGGAFIEINAAPDFRVHLRPTVGEPRPVAAALVDMLFPEGRPTRVPLFSVTGTLGKTTTVNLLAHGLTMAGYTCGMTSTDGLYVAGRRIMKGDMTYAEHAVLLLRDPTIDCAVLETSREGILRSGLGYEFADVGIVLNMFDDHVGADDIKYLEDLAYAKSVVAEQVYEEGHTVLSADHELVLEMAGRVYGNLVLISRGDLNPAVREHVRKGGTAVALDRDRVILFEDGERYPLLEVAEIPLLFGGRAAFNLEAVLAAIAAFHVHGLPREQIEAALRTFEPVPAMLPGRMNLFQSGESAVLVDYAHNGAGFLALKEFLDQDPRSKIGALDAAGDRSDEEILELGRLAAGTYDEIFLFEGFDRRGRADGEVVSLLRRGIEEAGFPAAQVHLCADPEAAWNGALDRAGQDRLVVLLTPRPDETLALLRSRGWVFAG